MKILPSEQLQKKIKVPIPNISKFRNEDKLQLDLGLKESPLNKLYEVRQKLDKFEDRLKLSHYWGNPFIWIMLIFPVLLLGVFLFQYYIYSPKIPDNVPLLWFNPDLMTILISKYWLIVIPTLTSIMTIICALLFRLSYGKLEKFIFFIMLFGISANILSYLVVIRTIRIFI